MSCDENRHCVILFALFCGNQSCVIFVSYKLSSFRRNPSFRLILLFKQKRAHSKSLLEVCFSLHLLLLTAHAAHVLA